MLQLSFRGAAPGPEVARIRFEAGCTLGSNGRDCYSHRPAAPVIIPAAGQVDLAWGGGPPRTIPYALAPAAGPPDGAAPRWAQLNGIDSVEVVQLCWRPAAAGEAGLERAVVQVRAPPGMSRAGAAGLTDRARVLAL